MSNQDQSTPSLKKVRLTSNRETGHHASANHDLLLRITLVPASLKDRVKNLLKGKGVNYFLSYF